MTQTLRYGIIGTGAMGLEHIGNIEHLEDAEVVAIADTDAGSLQSGAKAAGGEAAVFADHTALLAAGGMDCVVVATPNHTHHDVLLDCISAGVPILVEKPLCTTVHDCRVVSAAAARADAFVWMGLEYRYMPPIARVIQEVGAGSVGDVKMIAIREHRYPFLDKVGDWNKFRANTGGTLVEKCCHFFDLMNLIAGARPVRVMATGAQDVNFVGATYRGRVCDIIDNAYVLVDYDNGVRAMLDLCMFAEGSRNERELVVTGDIGKLEGFDNDHLVRIGRRTDGHVQEVVVRDDRVRSGGQHHGSSYLEHLALAEALRSGAPPAVTLEDGLWSVAVGEAAHRSIDEGRVVAIAEVFPEAVAG